MALVQKKSYTRLDRTLNLIGMSLAHTQLVIGIVLWFLSDEVAEGIRYWKWEHPISMILAIIAFTLGYSVAKRAVDDRQKHIATVKYYIIGTALVVITLASNNLLF